MMTKVVAPPDDTAAPARPRARWRRAGWIALPVVTLGAAWSVLYHEGPAVAAMPVSAVDLAQPPTPDAAERRDHAVSTSITVANASSDSASSSGLIVGE